MNTRREVKLIDSVASAEWAFPFQPIRKRAFDYVALIGLRSHITNSRAIGMYTSIFNPKLRERPFAFSLAVVINLRVELF